VALIYLEITACSIEHRSAVATVSRLLIRQRTMSAITVEIDVNKIS